MAYLSPDVYIEEVPGGARPIEAVGTSMAAFIGKAPKLDAPRNTAVVINNWRSFCDQFVGSPEAKPETTWLVHGVWGFFLNGGSRCYVVNVDDETKLPAALQVLEAEDRVAIVAAPGFNGAAAYTALRDHCEKIQDRVAILDGPERVEKVDVLTTPAVVTASSDSKPTRKGRSPTSEPDESVPGGGAPKDGADVGVGPHPSKGGYVAFYYPWIQVSDPLTLMKSLCPPSGHIAGIYARTDTERGVHKAPANETIRGAIGVTHKLTRADQDVLNPSGINCIRLFSTSGIVVWGARTVSSDPQWRYINVRRLFNMIKKSIAVSTRWVVFEPNDEPLWKAIVRDVSAFLMLLWRAGMLMGASPEQAFFVKCDAETNPPEVIDSGRVVTQIGIAPVKPAEFIIFQIGQSASGTTAET